MKQTSHKHRRIYSHHLPGEPPGEPIACRAITLTVVDAQNKALDPAEQALIVSNEVANDTASLGTRSVVFTGIAADPCAVRFEVDDPAATAESVVSVAVADRDGVDVPLRSRAGNGLPDRRTFFVRFVSDSVDDGVLREQTILGVPGENVVVTYTSPTGVAAEQRLRMGRPRRENDNSLPDQSKHDRRDLLLSVTVFGKAGTTRLARNISATATEIPVRNASTVHRPDESGVPRGTIRIGKEIITYAEVDDANKLLTKCLRGAEGTQAVAHNAPAKVTHTTRTPAATPDSVREDVARVNERYAQATVQVSPDSSFGFGARNQGCPLPGGLLDGFKKSSETLITAPNASERALVAERDKRDGTLDVFYVEKVFGHDRATAYPPSRNKSGIAGFSGFAVLDASSRKPFTLAHELLHLLLDAGHTPGGEVRTSLFRGTTSARNTVDATKRIGPNSAIAREGTKIVRKRLA